MQFYQLFINFLFHKNILYTSEVTALLLTSCISYQQIPVTFASLSPDIQLNVTFLQTL